MTKRKRKTVKRSRRPDFEGMASMAAAGYVGARYADTETAAKIGELTRERDELRERAEREAAKRKLYERAARWTAKAVLAIAAVVLDEVNKEWP